MSRENEYPIYRFLRIWYKPAKKEENPVNQYEFTYDIISGRMEDDTEIKQEFTLKCSEEPVEAFRTTLQALKAYICDLCEQPQEYVSRITVRGINLKYEQHENGSQVMGVNMCGTYRYKRSNGVLVLNTPFRQESFKKNKGGDDGKLLKDDCLEVIYELFDEAKKYIQGERLKQMIDYKQAAENEKAEKLEKFKEDKKKSKNGVDAQGNILEMGKN